MSKFPPKKDGFKKDYKKEREKRAERAPKKHSDVKDTPRPKVNADGVKEFDQSTYFASCPREVEYLLEKEIRALGITRIETEKGGIAFKCEPEQALDVLLQSLSILSRLNETLDYLQKQLHEQFHRIVLRTTQHIVDSNFVLHSNNSHQNLMANNPDCLRDLLETCYEQFKLVVKNGAARS